MTNEELIAALRYCGNFEDREGCDVECPYFNDYYCPMRIMCDAADALEAAEKRIAEMEKGYSWKAYAALEESIEGYKSRIAELEAQMPKVGEWIGVNPMVDTEQCSICGWNIPTYEFESNYCPNCGARMQTVTECHDLESER